MVLQQPAIDQTGGQIDYLYELSGGLYSTGVVTKNASLRILMMKLCAHRLRQTLFHRVHLPCCKHSQRWCCDINPESAPKIRRVCGGKSPGGIHAHSGQRRFERDVRSKEYSGTYSCVTSDCRSIRDI